MNKRVILKKMNKLLGQIAKFVFSCSLLYMAYTICEFSTAIRHIAQQHQQK